MVLLNWLPFQVSFIIFHKLCWPSFWTVDFVVLSNQRRYQTRLTCNIMIYCDYERWCLITDKQLIVIKVFPSLGTHRKHRHNGEINFTFSPQKEQNIIFLGLFVFRGQNKLYFIYEFSLILWQQMHFIPCNLDKVFYFSNRNIFSFNI